MSIYRPEEVVRKDVYSIEGDRIKFLLNLEFIFQVIQAGVGLIMPEFLFSGILWPSIGMFPFFKLLGDLLPLTLTCELARNLVHQGSFRPVAGLFMPVIWGSIYVGLSVMFLSFRLKSR